LCGLVVFLERTKPPPPLPAEVARLETEMDARATRSDEELKTLHDLKDESRRTWIASITADELATAGRAFCETALGDLRERLSGNEDGRMVYQGKSETPMLDLVRAGFLRVIVAPGHDADEAACVAAREDEDDANRGSDAKPKPGEWAAVNRAEGEGGKTIERIPGEGPGPGPGPRGPPSVAAIPRRATYCHRVAVYRLAYDASVMDDTMIIDAVVSQSDVIRFLDAHQKDLGEVTRRNLLEIGLVDDAAVAQNRGDVVCVLPTTRTLEAFSLMYSEGVSAVGVVAEPRGKLVDVLSVSDLRGFVKLPTLDLSVEEFKSLDARHRSYPGGDANVVSVRPDADIGDVLSKMAARKVHHVFVTDLDGAPIGMITPTDILSAMSLPSTEGIGWRFQSAELHSIYAWE
jgi:CBS domain-containing protein|tara:strand:- start:3660 stop:4871 length:1212 start_codon:yes stop_codon:yes gene_type:complete